MKGIPMRVPRLQVMDPLQETSSLIKDRTLARIMPLGSRGVQQGRPSLNSNTLFLSSYIAKALCVVCVRKLSNERLHKWPQL